MRQFIIQPNDSGQRLDKFFRKAVPQLPVSLLYKFLRTKHIKVNRKRADGAQMLAEGDVITCFISDEFFSDLPEQQADSSAPIQNKKQEKSFPFLQVPADLDVVYEDKNLLIINKPVGLVVHDDDHGSSDTLIARVLHYLYRKGDYHPQKEQSFTPALCNRLDRNTSGLVIAAKNAAALREINRLIAENLIHKSYLCVTIAPPPKKQDTAVAYHFRQPNSKVVHIAGKARPQYRQIITKYRVLAQNQSYSLLKIDLVTGRTHQIRAHMAYLDAALLGDDKYGNPEKNRAARCKYQQLCAYRLTFDANLPSDAPLAYLREKRFTCGLPAFVQKYVPQYQADASAN